MELREPTEAEKTQTAQALKNIANMLKVGMFMGQHSEAVHSAIQWLENGVSFYGASDPIMPETPKPDLKAVSDEQNT